MTKPELLMPAGNLETLKIAFLYGADAVYIGGDAYSLRARADNFSEEDMREAVDFAHKRGGRIYVTANIFAHNEDIAGIRDYLYEINDIKPDGVLVADYGVFSLARKILEDIEIHISTQTNITNAQSARFWYEQGASRIVAARELGIDEITVMTAQLQGRPQVEIFVHGAMCISYSGRCLLSNYFTGRDANKGACTHPCRWKYYLMEETRPGEYLPFFENERGSFIMNSKDLCMISHMPELFSCGADSLKVEGRMKSLLYVATTARAYRRAIDDFAESEELYLENLKWYEREVAACTNRKFTTGFFFGRPSGEAMIYDESTYVTDYRFLGVAGEERLIDGRRCYRIKQRNKCSRGERIEIMKPDGTNIDARILQLYDEEGKIIESAPHAGQIFYIDAGEPMEAFDIIRSQVLSNERSDRCSFEIFDFAKEHYTK